MRKNKRNLTLLGRVAYTEVRAIECEGWRQHSSLIFLILLFTKPNIEVSGWLYQTKTHFTHIVYQPFSRVSPPSFTLYGFYRCLPKIPFSFLPFSMLIGAWSWTTNGSSSFNPLLSRRLASRNSDSYLL